MTYYIFWTEPVTEGSQASGIGIMDEMETRDWQSDRFLRLERTRRTRSKYPVPRTLEGTRQEGERGRERERERGREKSWG